MKLVDLAIRQHKASYSLIVFVLLSGIMARAFMTIETFPNVIVPVVVTSVFHPGISPEDAARLLAKPIEQELRSIDGIVEISSTTRESVAYVVTEFDTNIDIDVAVLNTRAAVDRAKAEFPDNTDEPVVNEIAAQGNLVVVVSFLSDVADERELYQLARSFRDDLEGMPDVLQAEIKGAREEVAEIYMDPTKLEFYGITATEIGNLVRSNNVLIPAGDLDAGSGNFGVKIPSLVETIDDLKKLPVRSTSGGVVTLDQIADVRRTFKDATGFSRVNGKQTIAIEITKRLNANTIDTVLDVRDFVEQNADRIPQHVDVEYVFDTSTGIKETVEELSGNVVSAMALVMVIVVASLGFRSGMLVGFGIPFSLLGSGIVVYLMGFSFNFMVIFGLLLSLGMLIDGALVVTEYASRKLSEGASTYDAYVGAAQRMAIPIIASTLTTLAAFLPLMFWPGVVGDFMAILPVTVFSVLIWSLVFSLLVVPILGVRLLTSKPGKVLNPGDGDDAGVEFQGLRNLYLKLLKGCLGRPAITFSAIILMLVSIFLAYGKFNAGTVFGSAESEDSFTTMSIRAQGNLTVAEKIEMVRLVEDRLAEIPEVKSYYVSTNGISSGGARPRDEIAGVLLELLHSRDRELTSTEALDKVRAHTDDIPGIIVQVNKIENGPPVGKDVQIELSSENREQLHDIARKVRNKLDGMPGLIDVEDTLSLPGIEWQFIVDKAAAAMQGVNVLQIGQVVQMVTDGLYLGEFRPDDADEEVEIRLRFPESFRSLDALKRLRVETSDGAVPIAPFVSMEARPRVDVIQRVDSAEVVSVSAYTREGILASDMVAEIDDWMVSEGLSGQINYRFRGASEETDESARFLSTAFSLAMFLMLIILVAQFNSFYQAGLIISAVVMSTAGVMLGNMLTQQPFSILLTGVGLVALAGIVVNNNIVLIDTFNRLRESFPEKSNFDLALDSAKRRFRPVVLTTLTTVIGLMPLANGTSIDLINRSIIIGGPVASFWSAMAATIVNGLAFSTILTLLFTPTMLVLPGVIKEKLSGLVAKGRLRIAGFRGQE